MLTIDEMLITGLHTATKDGAVSGICRSDDQAGIRGAVRLMQGFTPQVKRGETSMLEQTETPPGPKMADEGNVLLRSVGEGNRGQETRGRQNWPCTGRRRRRREPL